MRAYYKQIEDGYIIGIGTNGNDSVPEISETEYNQLRSIIKARPEDPDGYTWMLRADTLEWEIVEVPPEPEPDAEISDFENALADLGVRLE